MFFSRHTGAGRAAQPERYLRGPFRARPRLVLCHATRARRHPRLVPLCRTISRTCAPRDCRAVSAQRCAKRIIGYGSNFSLSRPVSSRVCESLSQQGCASHVVQKTIRSTVSGCTNASPNATALRHASSRFEASTKPRRTIWLASHPEVRRCPANARSPAPKRKGCRSRHTRSVLPRRLTRRPHPKQPVENTNECHPCPQTHPTHYCSVLTFLAQQSTPARTQRRFTYVKPIYLSREVGGL